MSKDAIVVFDEAHNIGTPTQSALRTLRILRWHVQTTSASNHSQLTSRDRCWTLRVEVSRR